MTYLQRTTTLPDGVRVRGSHSVTIDEAGGIRITFCPAAVDLCYEEFEQVGNAISFEAGKSPNASCDATRGESVVLPVGRGEKRAAMAVTATVATPSWRLWASARGEVDPGHCGVALDAMGRRRAARGQKGGQDRSVALTSGEAGCR